MLKYESAYYLSGYKEKSLRGERFAEILPEAESLDIFKP